MELTIVTQLKDFHLHMTVVMTLPPHKVLQSNHSIYHTCHHNLLLNTNLKLGQNFTTKPVEKTLLTFKKWAWNMQTACHNDGPMAGMYPQGRPVITSLYGNCKMF